MTKRNRHWIARALLAGLAVSTLCGAAEKDASENVTAGSGKVIGALDGQVLATGGGRVILLDSDGAELWQIKAGNCHDVWKLDNGNVLIADGNIREVDPKTNDVVFSYKPEETKGGGAFSCQRLDDGRTLVGENSTGRILELDKDGNIVFALKVEPYKAGFHHNLRMVRKLANGNYLVCHSVAKLVREYTPKGEIVFEAHVENLAFSAVRLPNGNTIVGDMTRVVEFDPRGQAVWNLLATELKGVKIGKICGVNVLPNGNMVLGIYAAQQVEDGAALLEVTRDKDVVWRYVKYPKGDRAMMSGQKLDTSGKAISTLR